MQNQSNWKVRCVLSAPEETFEADPSPTQRTQVHATSFGQIPHLDQWISDRSGFLEKIRINGVGLKRSTELDVLIEMQLKNASPC